MIDDKRAANRKGKPLEFGEVIISAEVYAQNIAEAERRGYQRGAEEEREACIDALRPDYPDAVRMLVLRRGVK